MPKKPSTIERIEAIEKSLIGLDQKPTISAVSNEQPFVGTVTRGQAGKLGWEIKVYAKTADDLAGQIKATMDTFDQFIGIAPAETTLSAPPAIPYNAAPNVGE